MRKAWNDWIEKLKKEDYLPVLETMYLAVAAVYVLKTSLDTTLFELPWAESFDWTLRITAGAVVLLKMGYSRAYSKIQTPVMAVTAVLFSVSYLFSEYEVLLDIAVLAIGAAGVSGRKILKTGFWVRLYAVFMTGLGAFTGAVPDVLYQEEKTYLHSFGTADPADFAAHLFFLALMAWVLYGELSTLASLALTGGALYLSCRYCGADSVTALLGVLMLLILCRRPARLCGRKYPQIKKIGEACSYAGAAVLPAAAVLMLVLTNAYHYSRDWIVRLNKALDYRLSQGKYILKDQGLTAWGTVFDTASKQERKLDLSVFYQSLDSGYVMFAVRCGVVLSVWLCVLYVLYVLRARKSRQYRLLAAVVLAAVYGIFENHLPELAYNLFLICGMAEMDFQAVRKGFRGQRRAVLERKAVFSVVLIPFITAAVFLWKPFVMFWRTVWGCAAAENTGQEQVWFLLVGAAGTAAAAALYRGVRSRIVNRQKGALRIALPCAALVCVFLYGIASVNAKRADYDTEIFLESEILQVLSEQEEISAVYVDDVPLLYPKKDCGISYTVFRQDGVVEKEDCVLLTESKYESQELLAADFYYGEFSELHAVYTNSEKAASILEDCGVAMTKFYSSEHVVDLTELAKYNDVEVLDDAYLFMSGPEQGVWHGPYIDVEAGVIHVEYSMWLGTCNWKNPKYIATARVSALYGREILREYPVSAFDFDLQGSYSGVVDFDVYLPEDMRNVEFLLLPLEGTELRLLGITWRKVE